jgi:predicted nucleic acid-binding protein
MYLLDTNVLSELMRMKPDAHVEARFESEQADLFTSAVCIEEIRYGAKLGRQATSCGNGPRRRCCPT